MNTTHYEFCTIDASLKTPDPFDWYWDKVTRICTVPKSSCYEDNCLIPLLGVGWAASHFADHDPTVDTVTVYERGTEKPVAAFFPVILLGTLTN